MEEPGRDTLPSAQAKILRRANTVLQHFQTFEYDDEQDPKDIIFSVPIDENLHLLDPETAKMLHRLPFKGRVPRTRP